MCRAERSCRGAKTGKNKLKSSTSCRTTSILEPLLYREMNAKTAVLLAKPVITYGEDLGDEIVQRSFFVQSNMALFLLMS